MAKKKKSKTKKAQAKQPAVKLGKIAHAKRSLAQGIGQINGVLNRLEREVEGLVRKIVKQGERSRKDLRKNFDELLSKLKKGEFVSIAAETREEVEKEVRRLGDEILSVVREIENLPGRLGVEGIYRDARKSLVHLVDQLSENGFIHRAKSTLLQTRKEVLGLLSIPTQDEVEKLERKIVSLEKRLGTLSRKAA